VDPAAASPGVDPVIDAALEVLGVQATGSR
jgi:hypothetical protein